MSIEQRLETLKQVAQVAAVAGLKGRIDDDGRHFEMGFSLNDGRTQKVFVRVSGQSQDGAVVVTMFSPALKMKKGLFGGLSKEQAVELLRLNENTYFARFGLWELDDAVLVVASVDMLLATLDADELSAYALFVANAADAYEAKHGGDNY